MPNLRTKFLIVPVAPGQDPQAHLTMLYRSTDRLCRGGAAMKNLAHNASFHSPENNAPSEPGTKSAVLDQLLAGADPKTAFDPNGLLDDLKKGIPPPKAAFSGSAK